VAVHALAGESAATGGFTSPLAPGYAVSGGTKGAVDSDPPHGPWPSYGPRVVAWSLASVGVSPFGTSESCGWR
jgi:hypothetical protein